ncbi:uncharacterized protein LOC129321193 [Prosopis cineraria]|uniref:uncharacterized protein LOC129321193 n=1 Tax=Prosopis cineraria TaxID=364024 RepID=UPI00240ED2F0|nr:uncharacterized protein LOC129321193 [Prosopis cineraria]
MGNCSTSSSTQVATTAKLVLHDGRLQEFSYPVKASYVLQKYPRCFICNSDDMDFDDVVSAIDEDEHLQLGQLYFVLPLTRLEHRLRAEEMAALAVKASSALTKSSGGGKYVCGRQQLLFSGEETKRSFKRVSLGVNNGDKSTRRGRSGGKSTALLSAIPE